MRHDQSHRNWSMWGVCYLLHHILILNRIHTHLEVLLGIHIYYRPHAHHPFVPLALEMHPGCYLTSFEGNNNCWYHGLWIYRIHTRSCDLLLDTIVRSSSGVEHGPIVNIFHTILTMKGEMDLVLQWPHNPKGLGTHLVDSFLISM